MHCHQKGWPDPLLPCLLSKRLSPHRVLPSHAQSWYYCVPKPGVPANDASNMRPITLLPELGKITPRTLAKRITLVFHDKPDILCAAQRAYLMDGSSRQSLAALLDTTEDFQESRLENDGLELIVTSYDIRKAFDSVQHFTIHASCERL